MTFHFNGLDRKLLLKEVWGAADSEADHWVKRFQAYGIFYHHLLNSELITPPLEELRRASDVIELVALVKQSISRSETIGDILNRVAQENFHWLHDPDSKALENCLELAIRLWLFAKPCLKNRESTVKDAVLHCFPSRPAQTQPLPSISGYPQVYDPTGRLSEDFSARNLERKGGFRIDWTSRLKEHLSFPDKKTILVFRHARTLQDYQKLQDERFVQIVSLLAPTHGRSSMYPDGLLLETDRTIGLLFPLHKKGAEKRLRRLSKKEKADVEANWLDDEIEDFQRLQLSSYPIYQQRLLLIQQRYDSAKPSRPKQWWYDRRRRLEWAGLWIAVMVFILTLVTVATSVMQVYAGFHFH